jgi:hypothetical protein
MVVFLFEVTRCVMRFTIAARRFAGMGEGEDS